MTPTIDEPINVAVQKATGSLTLQKTKQGLMNGRGSLTLQI